MAKTTNFMLAICLIWAAAPAQAQQGRTSDPNLGHFYMGRQEVQIMDSSPIINDMRTVPGTQTSGNGGVPPTQALPKSGWQQYSPAKPASMAPLPKVENGVPKVPPAAPAGAKAKSAKIKPKTVAPVASGPKSYKPYAGYGGPAKASTGEMPSGSSGAGSQSSTNLKGSVLHWARGRRTGN